MYEGDLVKRMYQIEAAMRELGKLVTANNVMSAADGKTAADVALVASRATELQ